MPKILLKRIIFAFFLLIMCCIFTLYIIESVGSIISEQVSHETKSSRPVASPPAVILRTSDPETTAAEPVVGIISIEADSEPPAADEPLITEPADTFRWRVIERDESEGGQLQYYSPYNVSISDRRVVITSIDEFIGGKRYSSGMVESEDAYLYGKFSFVISVSEGKGLFPAIWLMPDADKPLPEIDIFEMIGNAPDEFYGVLHYMEGSVQKRDFFITKLKKSDTYLIELEWTKERLRWFIDGECMLESSEFVPNEPMYLIVNQAVGGIWPGAPDITTVFPATFVLESWTIEPEWSRPR